MSAIDSEKSICVGLIRCDTHGAYYGALMAPNDPLRLRSPLAPGVINPPVNVERDGAVVARACYGLDPDGIGIELFQEFADLVAR